MTFCRSTIWRWMAGLALMILVAGCESTTTAPVEFSSHNPVLNETFIRNASEAAIIRQIKAGVPLNAISAEDHGLTPIGMILEHRGGHPSAEASNRRIIRAMLQHGADPEQRDIAGCTPIYYAAANGQRDVVDDLLAMGAQIDAECEDGATPLYAAIKWGLYHMVQDLLERGANPNHVSSDGFTALGAVWHYSPSWDDNSPYQIDPPNPKIIALVRQYGGHE